MKTVGVRFLPSDSVRIGDVRGHISAVMISWPSKVRYEVTYWDCGQRREVWVDDFEVEPA